jgi:penicillin-binding protein 1A
MIDEKFPEFAQKDNWKQHFPTYIFKKRDIALKEYESSIRSLDAEERVFLQAVQIVLIVATALGSLIIGSTDKLISGVQQFFSPPILILVLIFLSIVFSYISLRYFADRQRAITFASRKVIVLRRMLGLSYGKFQLVLPNWRVEGADEPFAIRIFPGWSTYVAYPFWILTIFIAAVVCILVARLVFTLESSFFWIIDTPDYIIGLWVASFVVLFLGFIYRRALLDMHETMFFLFINSCARVIRLGTVRSIENILYRAKLAVFEIQRVRINTSTLKELLIFIEDKDFHRHKGISLKALFRAFLGLFNLKPKSGGSTISQQLVRTLFITEPTKKNRRKFIEILMALWIERVLSKNQILDLYLSSVRFEKGIYGVPAAMRYFWERKIKEPSKSQAFFLIERVSNIRSKILSAKIFETAIKAKQIGLIRQTDLSKLEKIYREAVQNGKLNDPDNTVDNLKKLKSY